jgi:glutathione S-transferase
MPELRVFTFSPDWGLPTTGPFALKLLAWLRLAKLPYEQVIEDDPAKGPAGKNPWVEIDGQTIGDSGRIIDKLAKDTGFDIDADMSDEQRAEGRAWMRGFEEGFHQILEWELFVHPAGAEYMDRVITSAAPPVLGRLIASRVRTHFRKQLHARGIGRLAPDEIAAIGRADLDALATRLKQRSFLVSDRVSLADLAVFGQVAPLACWPMKTPLAEHAKNSSAVVDFVKRIEGLCFT